MAISTTPSDVQDIRALIQEGLEQEDISDAQIQSDIFLGVASRDILARRSLTEAQYAALTPTEQLPILTAVKYRTAALMIPSAYLVVQQADGGQTNRYLEKDWMERISILNRQADAIVPSTRTTGRLTQVFRIS